MVTGQFYRRLLRPPKQSFFLFGMRGVGKSTWAQEAFPAARRIDLPDGMSGTGHSTSE
jgi:predicted kinase